ncbi:hypothetical protein GVN16_24275 [Emticicia sp. CRIBPO]|uniref:hypothetical protein n=1 Tax=Emticicia sp. CRIBPO TaxID=2683258 RepID=UPI0014126194|nr:hypothetical protein [Emticicia sp. CRIBPO]NBA88914.1 hypothetical protein [Emticicia sp. CRIBPO]
MRLSFFDAYLTMARKLMIIANDFGLMGYIDDAVIGLTRKARLPGTGIISMDIPLTRKNLCE